MKQVNLQLDMVLRLLRQNRDSSKELDIAIRQLKEYLTDYSLEQ